MRSIETSPSSLHRHVPHTGVLSRQFIAFTPSSLRNQRRARFRSVAPLASSKPLRRTPRAPLLPDRERSWSNPQGTSITAIAENVWLAERPFYPRIPGLRGTDVGCKSCIIKLPDGKLWVHAPVGLDEALLEALAQLGPVGHIVTPNTEHQKFASMWMLQYPEATSWACPGLREKKPDVGWEFSLQDMLDSDDGVTTKAPPSEWCGVIDACWIQDRIPLTPDIPFFNEVVFCHRPSGTLICTDLWWNYPSSAADVQTGDESVVPKVPFSTRLWKLGMDKIYRPVYNNLMRTGTCAGSYSKILGWNWQYIAPCHGEPVATNAKQVLREHLRL